MQKTIAILLFLLGAVEIFYGLVWGRMRIYVHELAFAKALRLQELSVEQGQAYNHYIDLFQQQWDIVAVFGFLTIVAGLFLLKKT